MKELGEFKVAVPAALIVAVGGVALIGIQSYNTTEKKIFHNKCVQVAKTRSKTIESCCNTDNDNVQAKFNQQWTRDFAVITDPFKCVCVKPEVTDFAGDCAQLISPSAKCITVSLNRMSFVAFYPRKL